MPYMSYKERIVDFFSKKININVNEKILNSYDIEEEYYNLLSDILYDSNLSAIQRKLYFSVLYKLIFYTRDTVYGINNYEASYIMIGTFIQFGYNNPEVANEMNILAFNALSSFIRLDGFHTPYGDWNDIKYFCGYLKKVIAFNNKNDVTDYQILKDIIGLYVNQLANEEKYQDIISTITPCMPREKSKVFGWLAYYISTTYYQSWINTATTINAHNRAVRKCLTHYRILLSNPNKLPLYTYKHPHKLNNKIIDNWTKLLIEVSNERYVWADKFSHTILDSYMFSSIISLLEEKFLRKKNEIVAKEIDEQADEVEDGGEDGAEDGVEDGVEDGQDDEQADDEVEDEEADEQSHGDDEENELTIIEDDVAINPLFDENNTNNKESDDNKKSGWFGWLGWN